MDTFHLRSGRTVGVSTLPTPRGGVDYQLESFDAQDIERAQRCVEQGFLFGDRLMCMEIDLKRWEPKFHLSGSYRFSLTRDWDTASFHRMACPFFQRDRRFAMDSWMKDEALKNELLLLYLRKLKAEECPATCLHKGEELVGFQLWKANEDAHAARIMLSVVAQQYANRGLAIYLYTETLQRMKERGTLILAEKVSTSNPAAVKLHFMLVGDPRLLRNIRFEDTYIYNRERDEG